MNQHCISKLVECLELQVSMHFGQILPSQREQTQPRTIASPLTATMSAFQSSKSREDSPDRFTPPPSAPYPLNGVPGSQNHDLRPVGMTLPMFLLGVTIDSSLCICAVDTPVHFL